MKFKCFFIGLCAVLANAASAQLGVTKPQTESRPMGFRFFNQHLTIKPYV